VQCVFEEDVKVKKGSRHPGSTSLGVARIQMYLGGHGDPASVGSTQGHGGRAGKANYPRLGPRRQNRKDRSEGLLLVPSVGRRIGDR
jgi:hypothetical protein